MVLSRANVYVGFECFEWFMHQLQNTSSNMQTVMLFIILFYELPVAINLQKTSTHVEGPNIH